METTITKSADVVTTFLAKVYMWMFVGLFITGLVALYVSSQEVLINLFIENPFVLFTLIIAELAAVIFLSFAITKISSSLATFIFLLYAVLNGVTLSLIFLIYTSSSISSTFLITAGTFGIMSIYGFVTKSDLTTIGNISLMALIGLILASVVNIFLNNTTLYWIITYAGILIFVGLIAYDTQKMKKLASSGMDSSMGNKIAIIGALTLYLDFINLFLLLLRIFGKRR